MKDGRKKRSSNCQMQAQGSSKVKGEGGVGGGDDGGEGFCESGSDAAVGYA